MLVLLNTLPSSRLVSTALAPNRSAMNTARQVTRTDPALGKGSPLLPTKRYPSSRLDSRPCASKQALEVMSVLSLAL